MSNVAGRLRGIAYLRSSTLSAVVLLFGLCDCSLHGNVLDECLRFSLKLDLIG